MREGRDNQNVRMRVRLTRYVPHRIVTLGPEARESRNGDGQWGGVWVVGRYEPTCWFFPLLSTAQMHEGKGAPSRTLKGKEQVKGNRLGSGGYVRRVTGWRQERGEKKWLFVCWVCDMDDPGRGYEGSKWDPVHIPVTGMQDRWWASPLLVLGTQAPLVIFRLRL